MNKFLPYLIGYCLLTCTIGLGQTYNFERYGVQEGLSQNTVFAMYQDRDGFMWFGTQQGLNRYDGRNFQVFNTSNSVLKSNSIRFLVEGAEDMIWVGTEENIYSLDLCTETLISHSFSSQIKEGAPEILSLNWHESKIWIGTDQGLFYMDSTNLQYVQQISDSLLLKPIRSIAFGDHQEVFLGTSTGLFQLNQDRKVDSIAADFGEISALHKDDELLWVGTTEGALYAYNLTSRTPPQLLEIDPYEPSPIRSLWVDRNHDLWVALQNEGLILAQKGKSPDSEEDIWTSQILRQDVRDPYSLSHNDVLSLFEDHFGGMWVGTFAEGANRYHPTNSLFHSILMKDIFGRRREQNFIWSILPVAEDEIWLGLKDSRIIRYNPLTDRVTRTYSIPDFFSETNIQTPTIWSLHLDKNGQVWAGSDMYGLHKFNRAKDRFGQHAHAKSFGKEQYGIRAIGELLGRDRLLFGTSGNGLFTKHYEAGIEKDSLYSSKIPNSYIYSICQDPVDRDAAWIGTKQHGLVYRNYRKKTVESISIESPVFCMAYLPSDSKHLWLGTDGAGLIRVNTDSKELEYIPLPDPEKKFNVIFSIVADPDSRSLWICGINGIAHYFPEDNSMEIYDTAYGLYGQEFNSGAVALHTDGSIILGQGQNGLVRFWPDAVSHAPQPNISNRWLIAPSSESKSNQDKEQSSIQQIPFGFRSHFDRLCSSELKVSYQEGDVTVKLADMKFGRNEQMGYFYQYETKRGAILDSGYVHSSPILTLPFRSRDVLFEHAATYHLRIWEIEYGQHRDLEKEANVELIILVSSPFWLSPWGILLGFLIFMFVLVGVYYIYTLYRDLNQVKQAEISHSQTIEALTGTVQVQSESLLQTNNLLTSANQQLTERTKELESRKEHLQELQNRINEVSRQESMEDVCNQAMEDMIHFFGFDYASLSIVDHMKNWITVEYNIKKADGLVDPRLWQAKEMNYGFSLEHRDILPYVIRQKKEVYVDGAKVFIDGQLIKDNRIDQSQIPALESKVFFTYDHHNLIRLFLPMKRRAKQIHFNPDSDAEGDYPLGVFEVGYHRDTGKEIRDQDVVDLKLYIDNCAQPYYHAYIREEAKQITEKLSEFEAIDHPKQYIKKILEHLCTLVKAELGGDFFVLPMDSKENWVPRETVEYRMPKDHLKQIKRTIHQTSSDKIGIFQHVVNTQQTYWSHNVLEDPYFIPDSQNVTSLISIPLIYQQKVIGGFNLYSGKQSQFDRRKAKVLNLYAEGIAEAYIRKKINHAIRNLIQPFDLFDQKEIYHSLVNVIGEHFQTSFVSVWEIVQEGKEKIVQLNYALKPLFTALQKQKISTLKNLPQPIKEKLSFFPDEQNPSLKEVLPDLAQIFDHFGLSSAILIPIQVEGNVTGFVLVKSQMEQLSLLPQDKLFLDLLIPKAGSAIQQSKIFRAFANLSGAEGKFDFRTFVNNLTQLAKVLLNADPVFLFVHKIGQDITFSDGSYSGSFRSEFTAELHQKRGEYSQKPVDFVNAIIATGTQRFRNLKEYEQYLNQHRRFFKWEEISTKQTFWYREKIQSSAAVRLEFQEEPIGVLFVNYRYQKEFKQETNRLIDVFAFLARNAIIMARNMDTAHVGLKKAEDKADRYRDAYLVIARGISHNIRNSLYGLGMLELDIQDEVYPKLSKSLRKSFIGHFEKINRSSEQITQLLNTFEAHEQREERIDIKTIILETVRHFHTERKNQADIPSIEFEYEKINSYPDIVGDPNLFSMIIDNLLSNAVKAIDKSAQANKQGKVIIRNQSNNQLFLLEVEDNGIGIDTDIDQKIYQPYFSKDEKGVGFGLYFVKSVLNRYFDGEVYHFSSIGKKTVFSVRIPLK
ncbi:MAG: two-component regulator propeller domain-containing protein [Bacteroidota bacterium]